MRNVELVVVGAGPAGIAAARTAARLGLQTLLVDEHPIDPANIRRNIPLWYGSRAAGRAKAADLFSWLPAHPDLEQAVDDGVELLAGHSVWGLFPDRGVAVYDGASTSLLQAGQVILATGATDLHLAFPGWTLGGVLGCRGALHLLETYGYLEARRLLVLGSGNVALEVARQAGAHGIDVVGIVEFGTNVTGDPGLASSLSQSGVPFYLSYTVRAAVGGADVEEVILARVDREGVRADADVVIKADTLCVAIGCQPAIELAYLAGCELTFDPLRGGHFPSHDADQRTTQPGILVAGDAAGFNESLFLNPSAAKQSGHRAALTAARTRQHTVVAGEPAGFEDPTLVNPSVAEQSGNRAAQTASRTTQPGVPLAGDAAGFDDPTLFDPGVVEQSGNRAAQTASRMTQPGVPLAGDAAGFDDPTLFDPGVAEQSGNRAAQTASRTAQPSILVASEAAGFDESTSLVPNAAEQSGNRAAQTVSPTTQPGVPLAGDAAGFDDPTLFDPGVAERSGNHAAQTASRTTQPGFPLAGDAAGLGDASFGDASLAEQSGNRAAQTVATAHQAPRPTQPLPNAQGSAYFTPWHQLADLMSTDDTIVCRCEEITRAQLLQALDATGDPNEVKRISRAGMGLCQGRGCRPIVAGLLASRSHRAIADLPLATYRPPVRPLPLSALATEDPHAPVGKEPFAAAEARLAQAAQAGQLRPLALSRFRRAAEEAAFRAARDGLDPVSMARELEEQTRQSEQRA